MNKTLIIIFLGAMTDLSGTFAIGFAVNGTVAVLTGILFLVHLIQKGRTTSQAYDVSS